MSRALSLSDLPGNSPGHQSTHSPLLVLTVLAGNLGTSLSGEHLAVNLGHLGTLDVRDVSALLLGEAAALSLGSLGALGPGGGVTLLLVDSLTLLLGDIVALLSGLIATLLLGHIMALFLGNLEKERTIKI